MLFSQKLKLSAGLTLALITLAPLHAQDRTLLFSPTGAGVSKPIPLWGLDTAWLNGDNVRRGALFMGKPQVDLIRFSFTGDWPLSGGDLGTSALAEFNDRMAIVNAYTDSHAALYLNNDSPTYDASFIGGDGRIEPGAWAALINATKQRCANAGRTVLAVSPYNEPDNSFEQGSVTRLGDVSWQLRNTYGPNFTGVQLYGASTLNDDNANSWYNTLNGWGYVEAGCTHQLAGSFDNYAGFFQNVQANGDVGVNDELHNVMEAIVGAEYGMDVGIWWGTAELARGEFVKASDGQRLAYAEHRGNWTAAAVYRGTNGAVQAFVGESERQALPTTYRFFSKDRDVFYDGDGPRRDYTLTTTGGSGYQTTAHHNAERVVNVTWGADVPPLINGRYLIVNRNSGRVLQVPGSSLANGVQLTQNSYTNGLNQQWDVNPLPNTLGGDYSYVTIRAAHSGVTVDLNAFSYNNGGAIQQWNGGTNVVEQWYLQYATNGYFKIRSRWSNKVMAVNGASTANGAVMVQWDDTGSLDQQWRLIPTNAAVEFVAPPTVGGVSATANAVSVQVNWNTSSATDLAGYTVLRSTTSGGPYEIAARGLTNTTFTDKFANQPQPYYYVVKAVDRSLNASANSAQVSATPTLAPAQLARYQFEGNTTDGSGNANHHISVNGSPTFPVGKYGTALDLDGASQYTMVSANILASVTNFTIACWVNWDGGSAWQRIFDFGNDTTEYMFLSPSSGGGTLRFAITTNGGGGEQVIESSPLPVGQWRHVSVTRSNNVARLYTNGVLVASGPVTIAPANFNPALNYLGKSQWPDPLFNGRLDEFYLYNYALSSSEIVALANTTGVPATPTGLAATAGDAQATLSWTAAAGASSYNVKRATANGGPYTLVATNLTTTYTNTGLSNGSVYYYVVSAFNIVGESGNSVQVSARPVSSAPTNIVFAATPGGDQLTLTWPSSHTGWRLQTQTNTIATGLGTNWFDVTGTAATNAITLPVDSNNGSVFYRLVFP